jgi:hypothetical protein
VRITPLRIIVLLALSTLTAFADGMTWGGTYSQGWQGIAIGPYSAIDGTTNTDITIFCLDFNDEIGPPYNWNANISNLNPSSVANQAQYGGNYNNLLNSAYQVSNPGQPAPNQISGPPFAFVTDNASGGISANLTASPDSYTRYLEAAWLFSEMEAVNPQSGLNLVAQVAAWDLFVNSSNLPYLTQLIQLTTQQQGDVYNFHDYVDSTSPTADATGLNFEQAVDYALNAAQAAVVTNGFNAAGWSIVTADPTWVEGAGNTIPAQEFLSPNATPPVPEPSAIILFATVAGMVGFRKYRRKIS